MPWVREQAIDYRYGSHGQDRLPIIAALNDVVRLTRNDKTGKRRENCPLLWATTSLMSGTLMCILYVYDIKRMSPCNPPMISSPQEGRQSQH